MKYFKGYHRNCTFTGSTYNSRVYATILIERIITFTTPRIFEDNKIGSKIDDLDLNLTEYVRTW